MADEDEQVQRLWAMARLALELLQIIWATATLVVLLAAGVTTLTLASATMTAIFLALSWTLFPEG